MALVMCKECGKQVSDKAEKCPSCGVNVPKKLSFIHWIGIVFFGFISILLFIGYNSVPPENNSTSEFKPDTNPISDAMSKAAATQMDSITLQVAKDAETQYIIAKREGDKTQICVQAMGVSAAYLQAKDERNYKKWKQIEKQDCKRVP